MSIDAHTFRAMALSFEGVTEAPHFDRIAFKTKRIFTTLAPDRASANICLRPEEQEFYIGLDPAAFSRLKNAWGDRGWTCATFAAIDPDMLRAALQAAWQATRKAKR